MRRPGSPETTREGVIPNFAFDPPALFLCGLFFSWLAVDPHDGRPIHARRSFRAGAVFAVGAYAISRGLYAISADWMVLYWIDPPVLGPGATVAVGLALYVLPFVLGYILGHSCRRNGSRAALLAAGVGLLFEVGLLVIAFDAFWWVGTREEILAGEGRLLLTHPGMMTCLVGGIAGLLAWVGLVVFDARRRGWTLSVDARS